MAYLIHKSIFSAPFGIFYVKMEILKSIFQKNPIQSPNGVLPICKLLFPNGSYRNGVCRALWAKSHPQKSTVALATGLTPALHGTHEFSEVCIWRK